MRAAPEPSDIIWENLELRSGYQNQKKIELWLGVLFLALLSFAISWGLQWIKQNANEYNNKVSCFNYKTMFDDFVHSPKL